MIHLFRIDQHRMSHHQAESIGDLSAAGIIWIDVVAPTDDELTWIKNVFGIETETPEEAEDIETSARIYEENGSLYLRADFMSGRQQGYATVPTKLAISENRLISLHDAEVPIIRLLRMRNRDREAVHIDAMGLLVTLYAMDVEYSADTLEPRKRGRRANQQCHGRRILRRHPGGDSCRTEGGQLGSAGRAARNR